MNTEDRLRRASEEIERVTASLTAPPIGGVRRSARLRTVGVAVGAAVGAIVFVGGVVLALGLGGEATLAPASPTDTTAPIFVDGIRVVIPELDPAPEFDLDEGAVEVEFQGLGEHFADEIRVAIEGMVINWLSDIQHVVFVGASGQGAGYVVTGSFGANAPAYLVGTEGNCLATFFREARSGGGCGGASDRESIIPGVTILDDRATFTVAGRAPEGSSVVVIEVDDTRFWRRTRDGYIFLAVGGPIDSRVRYIIYDIHGNVLQGTTIHAGEDPRGDPPVATTAPAAEDDGSCSGGQYPTTYPRSDLPEIVVQTLDKILLFGSGCWFDELAAVAGESFTSSLDGGDPAQRWASQEEHGDEPMLALMRILDMSHGTVELDDGLMYIWPAASAHDGEWDTIPEADKEALRTLYDDEDFAAFEEFGYYIGYRLGITENGDWSFFVAGD